MRELGHLDHLQSTLGRLPTLARLLFVNFANIRGNELLNLLLGEPLRYVPRLAPPGQPAAET